MESELLRFDGAVERSPEVHAWLGEQSGDLGAIALRWFEAMRSCGGDVVELFHDGCPVVCVADAPFAYVNVFRSHVNVGFYQGASLPDPAGLLQGSGKRMRHVKLRPAEPVSEVALGRLIEAAYLDIKARLNPGLAE